MISLYPHRILRASRALVMLALLQLSPIAFADEFAVIVERYRSEIVAPANLTAKGRAIGPDELKQWIASLRDDGTWADIDYKNRAGGAWQTLEHLHRIRHLARARLDRQSPLHQDEAAVRVIQRALDHWTTTRYQNPNWWQNEIGTPQVMRDVIVLLGDQLTGASLKAAMEVLHQFVLRPAQAGAGGANTVWSADLALITAALERDAPALARAAELLTTEVIIGGTQGIQADFSFHQHKARLQQFHYGRSFFEVIVRVAWLLHATPWAFSPEKATLLADYALEGSRWMSRGTVTVPGTLDRAVSRPEALEGADMRAELTTLMELVPARRAQLESFRRAQSEGAVSVEGFRTFPWSDFSAHHRPAFSFFLKTVSTRTETTEILLNENLKGKKLNWGDHYVITSGADYVDLPPVWNWDLLPGVTSSAGTDSIQRQPFVGGLGNGMSGLSAMDYQIGRSGVTTLTARKFWASHGDVVIGLIGALDAPTGTEAVHTALDQSRLVGPVTVASGTDTVTVTTTAERDFRDVRWIHHNGLVYVPLGDRRVSLSAGPVSGSWRSINRNYPADAIELPVFLPVLEHGEAPKEQASGFVIFSCKKPEEVAGRVDRPTWRILSNTAFCQAAEFADGTFMAAFYAAGEVSTAAGLVRVDQPCLVLIGGGKLQLCDPTQLGRPVEVSVGGRNFTVACPTGGISSEAVTLRD